MELLMLVGWESQKFLVVLSPLIKNIYINSSQADSTGNRGGKMLNIL